MQIRSCHIQIIYLYLPRRLEWHYYKAFCKFECRMTNLKKFIYGLIIPNLPKMHLFHVFADICEGTSAEDGCTHPNAYCKILWISFAFERKEFILDIFLGCRFCCWNRVIAMHSICRHSSMWHILMENCCLLYNELFENIIHEKHLKLQL